MFSYRVNMKSFSTEIGIWRSIGCRRRTNSRETFVLLSRSWSCLWLILSSMRHGIARWLSSTVQIHENCRSVTACSLLRLLSCSLKTSKQRQVEIERHVSIWTITVELNGYKSRSSARLDAFIHVVYFVSRYTITILTINHVRHVFIRWMSFVSYSQDNYSIVERDSTCYAHRLVVCLSTVVNRVRWYSLTKFNRSSWSLDDDIEISLDWFQSKSLMFVSTAQFNGFFSECMKLLLVAVHGQKDRSFDFAYGCLHLSRLETSRLNSCRSCTCQDENETNVDDQLRSSQNYWSMSAIILVCCCCYWQIITGTMNMPFTT
jgi:hypothetical protein